MKTIAILYGGKSGEHEVSLISAASIIQNLDPARYAILPIGISKTGEWLLQDGAALRQIVDRRSRHGGLGSNCLREKKYSSCRDLA
jgi:D-alanine-D-alanine ligase and related ATP-grasp enzymes